MSTTQLFSLPNELFPYIFQYLSSSQLVELLADVQSRRLQALIHSFITNLDISQQTDQWLQHYLPRIFSNSNLNALRLQDRHIPSFYSDFLSSNIQSIQVISSDWTTDLLKQGLNYIRQQHHLKQLSIVFTCLHGKGDVANDLFRHDSQFQHLIVTGRFLYFDLNEIEQCNQLRSLSIELEGMHRVFMLIENLPNLQELKVKLRTEERLVQPKFTCKDNSHLANKLQSVSFTGASKYFDHIEQFFTCVGMAIEYLCISIDLIYYIIDGKRLQQNVLMKMPRLSSLDLLIHSALTYCDPIDIQTFRSSYWQQFNSIIYWHDIRAHQHTLFTLPYKSDRFKHFSNNFLSSWTSNKPVSLSFEQVRSLSFVTTTALNCEIIEFMAKHFPNLKTLELSDPVHLPGSEDEDVDRQALIMQEDLLFDRTLQLSSITKLCFVSQLQHDDYDVFRRFLHLLPNLTHLRMYIGRSLFNRLILHENADDFVGNALVRIECLEMVRFYDEKNVLSNEEIRNLFPHAEIHFNYDGVR
ncbi:unnamed protein product [Adineta ricciae]|uniref:F-box domain-containing protein n=1 Tax=Adineta ricciae TaxID=249248 RepID=A0A814XAG7_ADIRI|nr:unnamed protein product [Adineta ricciae]CAF1299138.1 unnamed protein product [Adineta ricciae]